MKPNIQQLIHETLTANYKKYYRLAFSYVHTETDAMDIVQEGAYKAILKCDSLKNPEYADTWIYRIMINEALHFVRQNKKDTTNYDTSDLTTKDSYENYDLHQALNMLEPLDRSIVIMRYFEDMKLEQITDIMDSNISTIKSRLYRSLKKLKVSLSK